MDRLITPLTYISEKLSKYTEGKIINKMLGNLKIKGMISLFQYYIFITMEIDMKEIGKKAKEMEKG